MKSMTPIKTLREVGGETPSMLEQAEFANSAYGRIETEPAPPDASTGLPVKDATLSWGGGYSATVSSGRGDDIPFPEDVAGVSGRRSNVDPQPVDFGHELTANEPDGFEDRGSGIANIVRGGR